MSDAFTLDTSGLVDFGPHPDIELAAPVTYNRFIGWSDLTPFQQGYVEAALTDLAFRASPKRITFDMLAPETLAAMLKDCEAWLRERDEHYGAERREWRTAEVGADFWGSRDGGVWTNFPPLTLYLGDDGKIYAREDAR